MQASYEYASAAVVGLMLCFVRMTGMVALNPFLARRNVPSQIRVALSLGLAIVLAPSLDISAVQDLGAVALVAAMLRELFLGLCCSFVFQFFYYLLFFAGDFMDIQFGLSMARVFDPGTSIQTSVSGNLLTLLFSLYIFATDSHLVMIQIFAESFSLVPLGAFGVVSGEIIGFMIDLSVSVFSLALRLTLPFVAAEFVLEMSMGVLMKLIPQIHVFVINIQFKVLLAILLLFFFASPISSFLNNYADLMMTSIKNALAVMGGAGTG